jgi:hypothetical protein
MAISNKKKSPEETCLRECKESKQEFISLQKRLSGLPQIKAKPNFDCKMAAAFALELEKETTQKNKAWLQKGKNIRLPKLISDFRSEFL